MIIDYKPKPDSSTRVTRPDALARLPEASTSERKLSIELPSHRQIYTAGSLVAGIAHLGSKEPERIQEVRVSLVCLLRSIYHRNHGRSRDYRRETTTLIHRDQTLWKCSSGDTSIPPIDIPFEIILPDVGNDRPAGRPDTPLPPSFHTGKYQGWKKIMSYGVGNRIGFVKYHVKVSVVRKGVLTRNEKAIAPFVFLPPSPPPPLIPSLPEFTTVGDFHLPDDTWRSESASNTLRQAVFNSIGQAHLELCMPRVPGFPRLIPIPFFLCLTLQTRRFKDPIVGQPSEGVLLPSPQLDKASIFLQQTIHVCARGGEQSHVKMRNASPIDNMLHGITPEEGPWAVKSAHESGGPVGYWEKQYVWRGRWTCRETPTYTNRQLSWEYALVAEIPVKGLGNDIKLVSQPVEVISGVTQGANLPPSFEDMLDLPPDYFEDSGVGNDGDYAEDEKEGQ